MVGCRVRVSSNRANSVESHRIKDIKGLGVSLSTLSHKAEPMEGLEACIMTVA